MDKNSIIGLCIIGLLILGYSIFTQPGAEERLAMKHRQDSIANIQIQQQKAASQIAAQARVLNDSIPHPNDSILAEQAQEKFGVFANASTSTAQNIALENNLIRVEISSKGGQIRKVRLKKYRTFDQKPVELLMDDTCQWNLSFPTQNRIINTADLFFTGTKTAGKNQEATFRLSAGEGKFIDYVYQLPDNSYLLTYKINVSGLQDVISPNSTFINLDWRDRLTPMEQSIENERTASTIYYRYDSDDVEKLDYQKDSKESLKTKVQWIAFKQKFFTSVLIGDHPFESPVVETQTIPHSKTVVKTLSASLALPYEHKQTQSYGMRFYFGPNHFQTLKSIDKLDLEKLIPLGWGIFAWVNRFLVIPTFNYLNSFQLNFGIIILLLTIIVRIILLPFTYGSFKSQAKMRVLQPEMAELNAKYPDDPVKKQQETMSLYRKAGVNPLGGCIPGLLQLPILIAMFNFFPSSIELRQEPFLWAKDLSTYDSILDLSFRIPGYGSHVSLFTLLMTISTLIYTRVNMQMTTATNPQMKWMMYLMPILFLGFFNEYSAGLSYYYFLSNIFGFGQQYLFKAFIDEDKIHRQIQENKKKPVKKSGFQQRMEQMAKERGIQAPKKR